ncbi:MAG TPA: helix-turn-helix transcriptional regulator [Solirubrobacterales bacterium]|nr:helix-turn-helix transcriptional regulator [Solirubrobacterales bacterium]
MSQSVGKALHDARRRRRIDLAQVEESTKIRCRFLLAIENEEWDALPGEAYAGGFIRTYAAYLGLDGERLAEQHREDIGASRPGERLLAGQVQPQPPPSERIGLSSRTVAVLVSVGLVAVLVVAGLSGGGDEGTPAPESERSQTGNESIGEAQPLPAREQAELSLSLTATAEVWVCLLDAGGEPLVNGQILATGAEAGPFESGSFTVSFGNGEVSMMVNGQQASIPATSSPIGYTIGASGGLRELPEGERPTCT